MPLLRDSAVTFTANVGFTGFALITGVLLARTLGPEGRGAMASVLCWPTVLTAVAGLSLYDAVLYHGALDPPCRRRLFANAVASSLVLGASTALVAAALLPRFVPLTPSQLLVLRWGLAALPVWLWIDLATALLQSRMRFRRLALIRLAAPLVTVATLVALAIGRALTPATGVVATWGGSLAQAAVLMHALKDEMSLRTDLPLFRRCLRYAARVHGGTLAGLLNRRLDVLVLTVIAAPAIVGVYVLAKTLTELLQQISAAASLALFPHVASCSDRRAQREVATRCARWVLLLQLCGGAMLLVTAPTLIRLLWGRRFVGALPFIDLLLPASVFWGVSGALCTSLLGSGRSFAVTLAETGGMLALLASSALLATLFGPSGVAASVSISAAVSCAIAGTLFARRFGREGLRELTPHAGDLVHLRAFAQRLLRRRVA